MSGFRIDNEHRRERFHETRIGGHKGFDAATGKPGAGFERTGQIIRKHQYVHGICLCDYTLPRGAEEQRGTEGQGEIMCTGLCS